MDWNICISSCYNWKFNHEQLSVEQRTDASHHNKRDCPVQSRLQAGHQTCWGVLERLNIENEIYTFQQHVVQHYYNYIVIPDRMPGNCRHLSSFRRDRILSKSALTECDYYVRIRFSELNNFLMVWSFHLHDFDRRHYVTCILVRKYFSLCSAHWRMLSKAVKCSFHETLF